MKYVSLFANHRLTNEIPAVIDYINIRVNIILLRVVLFYIL